MTELLPSHKRAAPRGIQSLRPSICSPFFFRPFTYQLLHNDEDDDDDVKEDGGHNLVTDRARAGDVHLELSRRD